MNNGEVWKPVVGFEDRYEVSNLGRVKSIIKKWSSRGNRMMTPTIDKRDGYCIVCLHNHEGKQMNKRVHKLVMKAFKPEGEKRFINHKDGVKTNNNIINLEWATPKENAQHCRANNLQYTPKGNELPQAKLNPNKVRKIRKLYSMNKYSLGEIGKMVDAGKGSVFNVIHKVTWRHVE